VLAALSRRRSRVQVPSGPLTKAQVRPVSGSRSARRRDPVLDPPRHPEPRHTPYESPTIPGSSSNVKLLITAAPMLRYYRLTKPDASIPIRLDGTNGLNIREIRELPGETS
jgi:hypothetical protein